MNITFHMHDTEDDRSVMVSQQGVESIDDVIERFLDYLKGVGYTYVKQVVVVYDDGKEKFTL